MAAEKSRDNIIDLIQKCLALSKSDKPGEAANAMNKAQELLFKYKLTMAEVETAETKEEGLIGQDYFELGIKPHEGTWRNQLAHHIARYNFCKGIGSWDKKHFYFIGTKTDVEVVRELYLWVVEQLELMANQAWLEYFPRYDRRPTFTRSFYQAAVMVIGNRLYEKWNELKVKTETSTALVVQSDKAIKQYVDDKFGTLSKARYSSSSSHGGYKAGQRAGHQVDLSRKAKQLRR